MNLLVIGLNHKIASLELREEFILTTKEEISILEKIKDSDDFLGGVVLATCNRTEIYLSLEGSDQAGRQRGVALFESIAKRRVDDLREHIYVYQNQEALKHLYFVAGGLDSLVLGEAEILGQVKDSFQRAQSIGSLDEYLYHGFIEALRTAKRVRTESRISSGSTSVSHVGVKLAKKVFGNLQGETVLVLGAGKMSELTLQSLVDEGVQGVIVGNRTYEHGKELAAKFSAQAIKLNQLDQWIERVDIIISSTSAPHYLIRYDMIERVMAERRRPLFLIDIAVPRDVEPDIGDIAGVHLYDLDDLEDMVEGNMEKRRKELGKAENIIEEELLAYDKWLRERQVTPIIKLIYQEGDKIKEEEIARALKKADGVETEELIQEMANRLTSKLLHYPTLRLKEFVGGK